MASNALETVSSSIDEAASPVQCGDILEAKFRVERILGEGAMGIVVEATHLELEERVALKFLHEEARARPDIASRFAREARAASKIKNDHVARVYDVGSHNGTPFIVMELLHGQDLEKMLAVSGPMDPTLAVEYVIQACEGLTAAHVQGIVHRDIKPGNLFVTEHSGMRDLKVLDFGISKAGVKKNTLEDVDLLTGDTTQIMGSPHYMSPEQIRSTRDVDSRADIWSLGVVLYELITGKPPFEGTEITALIAQVLHEPHRTVRSLLPDVPTGLEEVIDHCLQKDPAKRYQSAAELAVALLAFAPKRSRAVAERAMTMMQRATGQKVVFDSLPPPAVTSKMPVLAAQPSVSSPAPRARSVMPWFAIVVIVFGLGGGAFALFTRVGAPAARPDPVPAAVVPKEAVREAPREIATQPAPAPVTAAPVESAVAKPAVAAPTPVPKQPVTTRPKPPPSASAANPESEIRLER
jgi:serine/threonine-protein kinase